MAYSREEYTERRIAAVQRGTAAIYRAKGEEIDGRLRRFVYPYIEREKRIKKNIEDGKTTSEDYARWLRFDVFRGERWNEEKEAVAELMYEANVEATEQMNEEALKVCSYSKNITSYQMEKDYGVDMGLTVLGIAAAGKVVKKKKVKKQKDIAWNKKTVENSVTKNIMRGRGAAAVSLAITSTIVKRNQEEIARRIEEFIGGADGAGTLEAMNDAEANGIAVLKQWIATLDKKTRDTHAILDGQLRTPNEPFEVGSYDIMFPRDPDAAPEMICNCRCALGWEYPEYPSESLRRENIRNAEGIKPIVADMDYFEWLEMKGWAGEY